MIPLPSAQLNRRESGIEWPLWAAVLGLMAIGAAFIFSTTGATEMARGVGW
jgi:hypothetical protein